MAAFWLDEAMDDEDGESVRSRSKVCARSLNLRRGLTIPFLRTNPANLPFEYKQTTLFRDWAAGQFEALLVK